MPLELPDSRSLSQMTSLQTGCQVFIIVLPTEKKTKSRTRATRKWRAHRTSILKPLRSIYEDNRKPSMKILESFRTQGHDDKDPTTVFNLVAINGKSGYKK